MKTIGIVGGTSWISTIDYYRAINLGINKRLGDNNFARCIIYSVNYQDIVNNNSKGNIEANYPIMLNAASHLKNSGASCILLAANTMNLFAERIQDELKLPVIHIAEVTAIDIASKGINKVGLLGTKFTMEMNFFKDKLKAHGIEAIIPEETDRIYVHKTITEELGKDIIKPETKAGYIAIMNKLQTAGAQGIILGCTEIPLLIKESDHKLPMFNTTLIHSSSAVNFALNE